jgi:hypothetical protein
MFGEGLQFVDKGSKLAVHEVDRRAEMVSQLKLKLKLFTTCAGKLDRQLSLGPLYFAMHDLLAS